MRYSFGLIEDNKVMREYLNVKKYEWVYFSIIKSVLGSDQMLPSVFTSSIRLMNVETKEGKS